jgi:hypothetical protein
VGTVVYLLTTAAELVLEGTLRDFFGRSAMDKRIHDLTSHVSSADSEDWEGQ